MMAPEIELRSDTFTKPTPAMMEAIMEAKVGDDVFGEDETTNRLQNYCASLFGYEAALFCTSGTMANQIAISCWTKPGDELICDALSHVHLYEGGGIASNSGVAVQVLHGDRGRISADQVKSVIKEDNPHFPASKIVTLENTVNKGGGSCYEVAEIEEIKTLCANSKLTLHLDGARLFNALVFQNEKPETFGKLFDSISICLSKGLGAPMGSVLLGSKDLIHQAIRVRKRWGGGWRQSGYMAAAGLFALKNHVSRLADDHKRAETIASILLSRPEVSQIMPVETNIVIFYVDSLWGKSSEWVAAAAKLGIGCATFGPDAVRMVTHLDFGDDELNKFSNKIAGISK
jgi:threonine aldolase